GADLSSPATSIKQRENTTIKLREYAQLACFDCDFPQTGRTAEQCIARILQFFADRIRQPPAFADRPEHQVGIEQDSHQREP
ncbi:MAG: hypothetical protein RQ729_13025, partial [Wenzhouxiangellaceae bacterium]|nr:hypothetical protein [Wenzhouxiangellaceae bacterium]